MTDCPFHSGVQEQYKALCAKIDMIDKAQEKALTVAKQELDRRLEGMNEFRAQLESYARDNISRVEFNLQIDKLVGRILPLEKSLNYREGGRHWSDYLITVGVSGIVFLGLHYILKL